MAKCPSCKNEINLENLKQEKKGWGFFKQEILYSCPHCDVAISVSRGKFTG